MKHYNPTELVLNMPDMNSTSFIYFLQGYPWRWQIQKQYQQKNLKKLKTSPVSF